ncbi:MAG: Gfo/Idh/MocA family oxidoreductase [Planctomycetaceae bacterium]
MKRRTFLATALTAAIASGFENAGTAKRRVAVIGHTGRGNYGHGLDTVWQHFDNVEVVAVADGDAAGLDKERKKLGIEQGYSDYRAMLSEVKPEFVSVCPRHADQHHDMALAAIEAGVKGLYVEKPFCRTPAEADSIIAACDRHGSKLAVAHRNRYHPALQQIDQMIAAGELGRLLELRGRGLGDQRGGGEDLWVLGCHIMNLIQYFAGDPKSCSAIMLQDGRHITSDDVKPGAEGLGPLAANEVHARYETASGVVAYYDSIANDGTAKLGYCLQLMGSKGMVTLHIDRNPIAHFTPGNPFQTASEPRPWIPITSGGLGKPEPQPDVVAGVSNHVLAVRDLMEACDNNRQPLCSVYSGAATVDMICAVFESHRQKGAIVDFPLQERGNALTRL